MPDNSIMGIVVLFIGVVILIGLTPIILGNTVSDCDNLTGYNDGSGANSGKGSDNVEDPLIDPEESSGWAKSCIEASNTNQDSFDVILVIPVVVAAVAILMVVRFL